METRALPPVSGNEPLNLHGDTVGAAIISAGFDDIASLTADLDAVLARRPSVAAGNVMWMQPSAAQTPGGEKFNLPADGPTVDSDTDFTWVKGDSQPADALEFQAGSADVAVRWVKKARRQRLRSRLRSLASWCITVVLGGAVVGGSMYVLLGRLPDFDDLISLGQRVWM